MAKLTVVPGGRPPRPFSISARGVAKFMIAGPYAARKVVEGYAFPREDRAPKMLPAPAKDLVWEYFRSGRDAGVLDSAIDRFSVESTDETTFAKGRRRQALSVARHLKIVGPTLGFGNVRRPRDMRITVEGLAVRSSLDFVCRTGDGKISAVIVNVAEQVSENRDVLEHYARIESEIAWQITRVHMPDIAQIVYVDAHSERVIRTHVTSHKGAWRNIVTTCDNIMIAYRVVLARRERQRREHA